MEFQRDLPVCIDLPGRLGAEVAAFAEAEAGWQVVAADGPLVPLFTVGARVRGDGATAVVLDSRPDAVALRDLMLAGALDVIVWPEERDRLLRVPERVARETGRGGTTPLLTVAGTRGGVGTSTVALTIAATVAWSGGQALCVGDRGLVRLAGLGAWEGPGLPAVVTLGRHAVAELPALAREVPGVPGLAVLGGGGELGEAAGDASTWPYDLVVHDQGATLDDGADVMVAGADAAVEAAAQAAVVLVVEHGPLDRGAVAGKLGRSPEAWLPYSHRVARAGSVGRVPSALPGSWVAAVRHGLARALR